MDPRIIDFTGVDFVNLEPIKTSVIDQRREMTLTETILPRDAVSRIATTVRIELNVNRRIRRVLAHVQGNLVPRFILSLLEW